MSRMTARAAMIVGAAVVIRMNFNGACGLNRRKAGQCEKRQHKPEQRRGLAEHAHT